MTAIPSASPSRWAARAAPWLVAALLAAMGLLYLDVALRHAREANLDRDAVDQSAYMNYAKKMHDTRYEYVGDRNRMPVYPFLLSLLYRDGLTDDAFFERAKRFNIFLSLALLAGLFFTFLRYLPMLQAIVVVLVTAFTLFVYRAPYVQCELLYYTLFFAAFLLACETLRRATWGLAMATGIVLALAHLTKASAPPAVAVFTLIALGSSVSWRFDPRRLAAAAVTVVCFLAVLSPYLITSRRVFGRYFYNVNTTFYMWYDARDEIFTGTRAHGDRQGWPDLPPAQIPGFTKYLREHNAGQIVSRVTQGMRTVWRTARGGYGYLKYLLIYGIFATAAVALRPRQALGLAREWLWPLLFAAGCLGGYLILYAWISQVHAGLHRLILALFLPLLFGFAAVVSSPRLGFRRVGAIAGLAALAVLAFDIQMMVAGGVLTSRGGS